MQRAGDRLAGRGVRLNRDAQDDTREYLDGVGLPPMESFGSGERLKMLIEENGLNRGLANLAALLTRGYEQTLV